MSEARRNEFGQPIGPALPDWQPPARPSHQPLRGRFCSVEPLDVARHARELFDANSQDREHRIWTYRFSGPFATFDEYERWLDSGNFDADGRQRRSLAELRHWLRSADGHTDGD